KQKGSPTLELIDKANHVLGEIHAAVDRRGGQARYREALEGLLGSEGDAGPLLFGVALAPSGTVDAAALRTRAAALDPNEQRPLLEHWLHELIFFAVFFAGEVVGPSDAAFSAELEQLRRSLQF